MNQPKKRLTPLQAIRDKCAWSCWTDNCTEITCDLYDHRVGQRRFIKGLTPLQAIRKHCLWCRADADGVLACKVTDCQLHIYRSGYTPRSKHYWV